MATDVKHVSVKTKYHRPSDEEASLMDTLEIAPCKFCINYFDYSCNAKSRHKLDCTADPYGWFVKDED